MRHRDSNTGLSSERCNCQIDAKLG